MMREREREENILERNLKMWEFGNVGLPALSRMVKDWLEEFARIF